MQMYKHSLIGVLALLAAAAPLTAVKAEDAAPYTSATAAYRQGVADLKAGNTDTALPALEYAAERGVLGAQLKLARIYAAGNGVRKNDAKAYFYYRQIANQRADISPLSPVSKYVAESFVALGNYYIDGIPSADVPQDPLRAAHLFRHAASYFGDADAQYALGKLYLEGTGVEKNVGLAVNWLATAAKKQHPEAQAKLGEILWRGGDESHQRPARGLALIMLAHANAKANGKEPKWIEDLYLEAAGSSTAAMRKEAVSLMPEFGGAAVVEELPAPVKATPAEELLVPASGGGSPAPAAASPTPASAVTTDATPPSAPANIIAPLGFGDMGSSPAGLKR
jgi:exopolysaccharide production negative regulator